jgi:hypothetical protein
MRVEHVEIFLTVANVLNKIAQSALWSKKEVSKYHYDSNMET